MLRTMVSMTVIVMLLIWTLENLKSEPRDTESWAAGWRGKIDGERRRRETGVMVRQMGRVEREGRLRRKGEVAKIISRQLGAFYLAAILRKKPIVNYVLQYIDAQI